MKAIYKTNKQFIITIVIIALSVLAFRFCFKPILVCGESMEPVYHEGQFIITHIYTDLNRFDCVTIKADNKSIIKRIIGLPGEKIEYKDNKLYINDVETPDPYGVGNTTDFVAYTTDGYFCLGDNRAVSYDSRYYGEFVRDKITSKANWS